MEKIPEGTLVGTYGGMRTNDDKPIAGRLLLVPMPEAEKPFEPRYVSLKDQQESDQLFARYPYLQQFFVGIMDRYADSIVMHESGTLLEYAIWRKQFETEIKPVNHFAGYYLTFRMSSKRERIYQRPIKIDREFGTCKRYLLENKNVEHIQTHGKARMTTSNVLSLDFYLEYSWQIDGEEPLIRPTSRHTNIYVAGQRWTKGKILQGMTTRLSEQNIPISFKEYFIRLDKDEYSSDELEGLIKNYQPDDLPENPEYRKIVNYLLEPSHHSLIISDIEPIA